MGQEKSKRHQRVLARKTIKAGEVNGCIMQSEAEVKLYLMRRNTEQGMTTTITVGTPEPAEMYTVRLSDGAMRGLVKAIGRVLKA